MDLSVVVATYNRAHLLAGTLEALAAQEVPASLTWEIVVVDNNSTDSTPRIVEDFLRTSPLPVRYALEPAQGTNHARNRGVGESTGTIIAFTDDDVVPARNWVRSIVAGMSRWGADGIGGRILPQWLARPPAWLERDRHLWEALALRDAPTPAELRLTAAGRFCQGVEIWGANMAFRRSLFDQVGVFDPSIGHRGDRLVGGDETEFVRRAVRAGCRIVYDPDLIVWHRIGPERLKKRFFRRKCFHIGEARAARTTPAPRRCLLGVPLYQLRVLVHNAVRWIAAILRRDPDCFCKELELWDNAGFIVARLKARLGTSR